MTKLFYDRLIVFEDIEKKINEFSNSQDEREEIWNLVDQIINHKVIKKILDTLPRENHEEFLEIFHKCPYDEVTIFAYLKGKSGDSIIDDVKNELRNISEDILAELKSLDH